MDAIINFLEQYWGYTLFGGISLGTIATFTITQVKLLLKDKVKNKNLEDSLNAVTKLCEELETRTKAKEEENTKLQVELKAKNEYFEKVQAATFQAISYLVIASKLPTEDKIALQEKFTALVKNKAVEYTETISDEVNALKNEITETIIPDAITTVEDTVAETKSLLDRYTQEG